jgi:polyhydroxyalkanoate synthase subunit PhaC
LTGSARDNSGVRLFPVPSLEGLVDAAANAFDMTLGGGLARTAPTPSAVIADGPQRKVRRYRPPRRPKADYPVLLVPPLAAPPSCFDLRHGCSVVEHLTVRGYRTYLVDYGPIGFSDRSLGLEHWVEDVIPGAIGAVSRDRQGRPVHLVGWCLGGIMSLLAVAGDRDLHVASVSLIASPFDFTRVRLTAPIRKLAEITGGRIVTSLYRTLGGAPAPLVSLGFQLTALDKRLTKPLTVLRNLDDREMLAHIEAVDDYMANMLAYPGRTFGQLYHRFFLVNELAGGCLVLSERTIRLSDVDRPVLVVAGATDVLAPQEAVFHVADLLTGVPEIRLETGKGGHLGVLTGRGARSTTWRYLDEFLAEHDPGADVPERPGRPEPAPQRAAA